MRLTRNKVHSLAEKIVAMLDEDPEAEYLTSRPDVESAIAGAILADLEEEEEIDGEVEEMLSEYQRQIEGQGMDAELLRRKFKDQLAKKRGFVV